MLEHNNVMSPSTTTTTAAPSVQEDAVARVHRALAKGTLRADSLTTRELGAFVGKTTSVLYHHWGSLDGFLHAVSQAGFVDLGRRLQGVLESGGDLADVAESFVAFGLQSPALYSVMLERRYDWAALRKQGAFVGTLPGSALWSALTMLVAAAGSDEPDLDARIFFAGLHGLVSLALSGRANVGALTKTDRELAIAAARRLARRIGTTTVEGDAR